MLLFLRGALLLALFVTSSADSTPSAGSIVLQNTLRMQGSSTSRPSCDALRSTLRLENTTILEVAYIQANSSITTPGSCQSSATVSSPLCRIYAQVNTTESSSLKFEAWLPDLWYGRLITIGSGGLSACKHVPRCAVCRASLI